MAEYRREFVKTAIVAVLSACLLGAIIYCLFQPLQSPIPVAFALGGGEQFLGNYSVLDGFFPLLEFTFSNGSGTARNLLSSSKQMNLGGLVPASFCGEIDATELRTIILSFCSFSGDLYDTERAVGCLVACHVDRIINATLVDGDKRTDLGSSKNPDAVSTCQSGLLDYLKQGYYNRLLNELGSSFNVTGKESSSTGYWKVTDFLWAITAGQLSDMLQASGIAQVTFTAGINMELKYRIIDKSGEDLTGNTSLSWTGTLGTLRLQHEAGRMSKIEWEFTFIGLMARQADNSKTSWQ